MIYILYWSTLIFNRSLSRREYWHSQWRDEEVKLEKFVQSWSYFLKIENIRIRPRLCGTRALALKSLCNDDQSVFMDITQGPDMYCQWDQIKILNFSTTGVEWTHGGDRGTLSCRNRTRFSLVFSLGLSPCHLVKSTSVFSVLGLASHRWCIFSCWPYASFYKKPSYSHWRQPVLFYFFHMTRIIHPEVYQGHSFLSSPFHCFLLQYNRLPQT